MNGPILLVDDNESNLYLARVILEQAGLQVVTASDGAEALEQARSRQPRLILMDMQMPILDGYETTRRLKADAGTRAIPVVAVTASAMADDIERTRAAGCVGHISKPIDAEHFAKQVMGFVAK